MQEDLLALEEVVVTGYATEKKSDITGAVSTLVFNDEVNAESSVYTKPIPPGGSVKAYKELINDCLDRSQFQDISGKLRGVVTLFIQRDGSIKEIQFQKDLPTSVSEEYRRCILKIQSWKPATEEDFPIDAEIGSQNFDGRMAAPAKKRE